MERVFFQAKRDALENITELYNFFHSLTVSFLFTRKEINRLNADSVATSDADFKNVIDPNTEVHGVGYRKAFIDTPWEEQEQQLAWILLNNLFAIHEGWASMLYNERFRPYHYQEKTFEKALEYTELSSKFNKYFCSRTNRSTLMENTFFDVYKNSSGLDFGKLDNYMLMYRFFKEARNCYMHGNKIASQKVINAYNSYAPISTLSDLDTNEVPIVNPPILRQPIQLNLRGIIGFSQFLRRILIISDINLIKAEAAEAELIQRKPQNWKIDTLSSNHMRCVQQLTKYTNSIGLLRPRWSLDYQNFMITNGLFYI